jgi:hypothetical protein
MTAGDEEEIRYIVVTMAFSPARKSYFSYKFDALGSAARVSSACCRDVRPLGSSTHAAAAWLRLLSDGTPVELAARDNRRRNAITGVRLA